MQISQGSDSKDQNLTSPPLHTCFCLIVKEGSHPDPTQPTLDTCQVHADWPLARGYTGQSAQFHQKPSSEIPWALSSTKFAIHANQKPNSIGEFVYGYTRRDLSPFESLEYLI